MGEIRPKKWEPRELTKDQLAVSPGATDTDMVAGMLPEGGIYVSDRCLDRARLVSC